jgi:hypothetical protein
MIRSKDPGYLRLDCSHVTSHAVISSYRITAEQCLRLAEPLCRPRQQTECKDQRDISSHDSINTDDHLSQLTINLPNQPRKNNTIFSSWTLVNLLIRSQTGSLLDPE